MHEPYEIDLRINNNPDLVGKTIRAMLDQRNRGDRMSYMDIPSNSEIFLVLSNLISKIEDLDAVHNNGAAESWYLHACDLRDRLMASDLQADVPPKWVRQDVCSKCGGSYFPAAFSSTSSFAMAPHSIEFASTLAPMYDETVNIEFDNRRVRVGSGQTMRRWVKHNKICGTSIEDTPEILKPIWLATYKPVDKESSVASLMEIIE